MKEKEFKKRIQKNKYQVFFFCSPVGFPFWFAVHAWVVTNANGIIHRWEISAFSNSGKKHGKLLYRNATLPWNGIELIKIKGMPRFPSIFIDVISGGKNSLAHKMVTFIKNTPKTSPYTNTYHLIPGPTSNTYIQWILNHFPKATIKLPWNAFGKNYRKKGS